MKNYLNLLTLRVLSVLSIIAFSSNLYAQNADERVGGLINASDLLTLRMEYPLLRDSMQVEFLKLLADGLLANKSNRYPEGSQALETLLKEHAEELGQASLGITAHLIMSYGYQGRYTEASALITKCMQQIQKDAPDADVSVFALLKNLYSSLVGIPAPSVSHPMTAVTVPCRIDRIIHKDTIQMSSPKYQLKVPISIGNQETLFVFDTGAGMTLISEKLARQAGVRIVSDSIVLGGVDRQSLVARGVIDSLEVGGVKLYHQPVLVRRTEAIDSLIELDAVLGIDIMRQLGVITLDTAKNRLIISSQCPNRQESLPMLIGEGEQLTTRVLDATDQPLIMLIDTGRSDTELYTHYYNRHKATVEAQGVSAERNVGGIGSVKKYLVRVLPSFHLKFGTDLRTLTDVDVYTQTKQGDGTRDGALGLDLWRQSKQVTLDFIGMTTHFK